MNLQRRARVGGVAEERLGQSLGLAPVEPVRGVGVEVQIGEARVDLLPEGRLGIRRQRRGVGVRLELIPQIFVL